MKIFVEYNYIKLHSRVTSFYIYNLGTQQEKKHVIGISGSNLC